MPGLIAQVDGWSRASERLNRRFPLLAGAPLQCDDAGVVLKLVGLMRQDLQHEAPKCLGRREASACGADDEVGQPLLAKELPGRGATIEPVLIGLCLLLLLAGLRARHNSAQPPLRDDCQDEARGEVPSSR